MQIRHEGASSRFLTRLWREGRDDLDCVVEGFIDPEGGWPLRCCLRDSSPGDTLVIAAHSPYPDDWTDTAYREIGPVVVHASRCAGHDGSFPSQFEGRRQIVRGYGRGDQGSQSQVYDCHELVDADGDLRAAIERALSDPRVDFAQVRNVLSGCWSFTSRAT